jgi:hypothetical protein
MADIGEFAQQVAEQFTQSQHFYQRPEAGSYARFHLGLQQPAVECLVRAVFYASTIPDEGRYPIVSLMCYRADADRELHLPLCPPREPTQQNIAKLAHAVGTDSHLCIVCDNGVPMLAGIHVTVLDEMRQLGYSSFRVGNPFKLRIRGPGHIEASTGGIALVYKAGVISEERLLQESDVMGALRSAIGQELEGQTTGVVESLEDVFNDIAEAIVRQGHGGMLLAVKDWDESQFSSNRCTGGNILRQRLVRYYDTVAALNAVTGGAANTLAGVNAVQASPHHVAISSETSVLEKCVNLIANLAGMDGAIVMDFACNVVAFNAIIDRGAGGEPARLVDEIDRTQDPAVVGENRGSRHQSAMSFARRVLNSFAFVISQDGGVTAFHNRGDGTCRWEGGLRVLD